MNALLNIGCQLVAARRALGLSQRELGEHVGVHQQQIARWEASAYRSASLERVSEIAAALTMDIGAQTCPSAYAAEATASYASPSQRTQTSTLDPVRDLGAIAARIRQNAPILLDDYGIGSISVFGSFACGEQTPDSDVDLLIEFADRSLARGFRFVEAAQHVEELLGRKVDFTQPALLKEGLREHILREAIIVWTA